jgi:hypothetical protein
MRLTGALIFAGVIASVSSILNYSRVDAQTSLTATVRPEASSKPAAGTADTKNKNFDLSTVSKTIGDEASRLRNDAAGWDQKMQQIELDLNKSQQDDEATARDVDESLVVLRAAAGRLGPDAETRVTLHKQEVALRELASRAEVHSLPEIRKTAGYFQQKTTELHALNRSIEETRMGLVTQIDLLQELKVQLEFNRAAGQIDELLKRGAASLDNIQVIAANAQQLGNDLAGFGRTPAAAAQSADGTNPTQATKTPAALASPAEAQGRANRRAPAAHAPGLAAVPAGNALRAEIAPAASARATQAGPPNTKEMAPGFILLPSRSPSIDSAHRTAVPSSPKPAAANPPPTTRGVTVAPDGRL